MANQKLTARQVMQNRVNGVIKSFQTFHTSLKNNRDKITDKEFDKMLAYLKDRVQKDINELSRIYYDKEDFFKFDD